MKLGRLGQGGLSRGFSRGGRGGGFSAAPRAPAPRAPAPSRGFTAAPAPTVHPVMASRPGTYGGPPGSFITRGACPPGYSRISMPRGPSQPQEYRCIPRVAAPTAPPPPPAPAPAPAPAPPITVSPAITVSPVMQQEFSPQFSPVMTMQQASPGAGVQAAPIQTAAPTQAARTAAPPAAPVEAPPVMPAPAPMAPSTPAAGPAFEPIPTIPDATIPPPAPMMRPARFDAPAVPAEPVEGFDKGLLLIYAAAAVGLFLITRKPKEGKAK